MKINRVGRPSGRRAGGRARAAERASEKTFKLPSASVLRATVKRRHVEDADVARRGGPRCRRDRPAGRADRAGKCNMLFYFVPEFSIGRSQSFFESSARN